MITEQRSGIALENLQETLDASTNSLNPRIGAAQYFTDPLMARRAQSKMRVMPNSILDPQCGKGALVNGVGNWGVVRFGVELDSRIDPTMPYFINANCVRFADALDDVYPDTRWEQVNANPPFSLRLKQANGTAIDSTEWTWNFVIKHGACGYFIANHTTIEKLGIDKHPAVFEYEVVENAFDAKVTVGIVYWRIAGAAITPSYVLIERWNKVKEIIDEEKVDRPDFNIWLHKDGTLRTYLSIRNREKLHITGPEIQKLASLSKAHPLTLTTERETRDLLRKFVDGGVYTIEPAAKEAIQKALTDAHRLAVPLLPVTPFETTAYADEEEQLLCLNTTNLPFTSGKKYKIVSGTYKFTDTFDRERLSYNEESGSMVRRKHTCSLSGQDRFIEVIDDRGRLHRFMDRPRKEMNNDHPDTMLWEIFQSPVVKTVRDVMPEVLTQNTEILRTCEMMAGFKYYPGQLGYLATVGTKDYAVVAGAVGTGKTLMALSLIALKGPERTLIIAPQGTMRSSQVVDEDEDDEDGGESNASQWLEEIQRFAPYLQVYELFSYEDYKRITKLNGGVLPPGVYVTYYEAFFQNGSRETACEAWDDEKMFKACNAILQANTYITLPALEDEPKRGWADTIGTEKHGIRCIIQPCLSTLIGHNFDCVLVDESHKAQNLDSNLSQMLIRLQPKYRYALTATPIPNLVSNLFSIMGWLCVPGWYKGNLRNPAWPYAKHEQGRFDKTFLTVERDYTAEEMKRRADPKWKGKVEKVSPVISAAARLLKLLKPTMAYIDKPACNPDYRPPKMIDVRVPFGKEQAKLYSHFLDRGNIPAKHPLVRARKQTQYLRAITSDPRGFRHHTTRSIELGLRVRSNMNPKVLTTLQLIRDILAQGEQVTIVSSRVGLNETIAERLADAGIEYSRIDSTIHAEQHSYQANRFKAKRTPVMLMGLKCAASHSFAQCKYLIVVAIEWSPGVLQQAKGRIDRVISRPGHTIYCVLTKASVEEIMFDVCATKDDAATICLKGERVPRSFKPVDGGEVLAAAYDKFDVTGATPEVDCEEKWPALRESMRKASACKSDTINAK